MSSDENAVAPHGGDIVVNLGLKTGSGGAIRGGTGSRRSCGLAGLVDLGIISRRIVTTLYVFTI